MRDSAANVGHIDVNVRVDKISERLFWKGLTLSARETESCGICILQPMLATSMSMRQWTRSVRDSAANAGHIDVNETVLEQSKLHNTPAMLIVGINACLFSCTYNSGCVMILAEKCLFLAMIYNE